MAILLTPDTGAAGPLLNSGLGQRTGFRGRLDQPTRVLVMSSQLVFRAVGMSYPPWRHDPYLGWRPLRFAAGRTRLLTEAALALTDGGIQA